MQFNKFMELLSTTNSTLDFFVDFGKVSKNINKISIKLNQLNYLIGKENLEQAIRELYRENSSCFSILNILIAVRDNREVIAPNGEIVKLPYGSTAIDFAYFLHTDIGNKAAIGGISREFYGRIFDYYKGLQR